MSVSASASEGLVMCVKELIVLKGVLKVSNAIAWVYDCQSKYFSTHPF